ncbi:MAG TPA: mycothiol synthase [Pseudonocardia sp.]|nr:mycothiol synthase [Pseudonocardia sp.]
MDEAAQAAVRELAAAAAAEDEVPPLSEHVLLHLGPQDQPPAAHLLAMDGATLVGVAHLDLDPEAGGSAELTVHPQHRRAGLGTALAREVSARVPVGRPLRLWAHGDHPGAAALAARLGFRRVRELLQLRAQLGEPPAVPPLPDGVRIRAFRVGTDEAEFLRVNNAAFSWHPEQGGWSLADVQLREREEWFDPDGFLLAVDSADRLLGYHWTKVHPDERIGEVYVLGVDPEARGLRLGRTLTLAGLKHLYEHGLRTMMLYVESDNGAALRLYSDLGFTRWHADIVYSR